MSKSRNEVSKADCWNLQPLYSNLSSWEKDLAGSYSENAKPKWPKLASFRGKLGKNSENIKAALEELLAIDRKLAKLYTYIHLLHDEDITVDKHKSALKKITAVMQDFQQESAWFEPELLAIPEKDMIQYLKSPFLANYRFHIEKILRIKPHTLPAEQEELIALATQMSMTPHRAFSAINDADFKFGVVTDSLGKEYPLTHASYGLYVRDKDRALRQNAFLKLHTVYDDYENTLCELISGQIQSHVFYSRAKRYSSSLEAALFPKNIDTKVYHALIQAVHENIGALHKYVALRKKVLGLNKLHLYDMSVPLTPQVDVKMPYKDAEELVIASTTALGNEYQNALRKGLKEECWVDRYENENKRSGAYSSGCFDSSPYILMNYKDLLRDVFTLAHEVGHSMHSYLSRKNQPYQYSEYPIFLAEVASTFNEELLIRRMLESVKSKEERIYLLTQKIEDIRTTLFRQVLFAEFELFLHTRIEHNEPLTPKVLRDEMRRLNSFYYGSSVEVDEVAEVEWARIPHFYYNYYVYQYATGISAALALADRVLAGGKKEREEYLTFLKAGCSHYPIETLKMAGVDMRSVTPVKAAIKKFEALVDEVDKLTT